MHITSTIPTSHGPRRLPLPPLVRVALTPEELHALARQLDRDADQAERGGLHHVADRLASRAVELHHAGSTPVVQQLRPDHRARAARVFGTGGSR